MFKKITRRLRNRNWSALLLDLIVVVFGILLAFQIDRAYESWQAHKAEQAYLQRLLNDLENDILQYNVVIERTDLRLQQIALLNSVIQNPEVAKTNVTEFVRALERITWRNFPVIKGYTYNEMVTTGNTTLLRSEKLRENLSAYYSYLEDTERLSFGENDQDRFRDETIGILSQNMLMFLENEEKYPLEVSDDNAESMVRDFAGRTNAHPWLGRLAKYQVLMAARAEAFTEQALNLQKEIQYSLR